MSSSEKVDLHSLGVLIQLKSSLGFFSGDADSALSEMELIIRSAMNWLDQCEQDWKKEERKRRPPLEAAKKALLLCERMSTAQKNPNLCAPQRTIYMRARKYYEEAEHELKVVIGFRKALDIAINDYRRQAFRLKNVVLAVEIPKAQAFLDKRISIVQQYNHFSQTIEKTASASAHYLLGRGVDVASIMLGGIAPFIGLRIIKGAYSGYFNYEKSQEKSAKSLAVHVATGIIENFIPGKDEITLVSIVMTAIGEAQMSDSSHMRELAMGAGEKLDMSQRVYNVVNTTTKGNLKDVGSSLARETMTFFSGVADSIVVGHKYI